MSRKHKTEYSTDQIARSFVTAFLRHEKKPMSIQQLFKTGQAVTANMPQKQKDAVTLENITQAVKDLTNWNLVYQVTHDSFSLPEFLPKFRTLDDTWLC